MTSPLLLWLDSISPVFVPPITLKQTNTVRIAPGGSNPFSVTLPGSYSTATGDCIIIVLCIAGTFTPTVSGCGATWVVNVASSTNAPTMAFCVGYGCTSGGTSVSIGGTTSANGDIVVSVWGNVKSSASPIGSFQSATTVSSVGTLTTPSISYTPGQLVIGGGGSGSGASAEWNAGTKPAVWSDGATNTNLFISQTNTTASRPVTADYELPQATSSTTLKETVASGTINLSVGVMTINHA